MFLAKDVDLYTMERAIKYYEDEKGGDSIEKGINDDTIVYQLLVSKRNDILKMEKKNE